MNALQVELSGSDLPTLVPQRQVRVADESSPVRIPAGCSTREPRLEFHRDGNAIRAIDVICGCGETIRIVCEYESSPAETPAASRS